MSLATTLRLIVSATETTSADLGSVSYPVRGDWSDTLATGTGADQADKVWADTRTLAATTSEDIDLAGTLTNPLGGTVTFARIKAIGIRLQTTTAGYTLEVGGAASNQFYGFVKASNDIVVIRGGGALLLWAPDATAYAVAAGTGDLLKIYNPNALSVTYDVILIGASA